MGEFLQEWAGWIVGLLTVVGTFIYNSRKVQVDESALVLGQWKALVENHQSQIATLTREIVDLRKEVSDLRTRVRELEEENAGLKRAIVQNSQSTVYALGRMPEGLADAVEKFDVAGHNSKKKAADDEGDI